MDGWRKDETDYFNINITMMNDLEKYQVGLKNETLIEREEKSLFTPVIDFFKGLLDRNERTPAFYKGVELILFVIIMLFIGFIVYINY